MTDLLDVLRTLDPSPATASYDDATADRNVAAILAASSRGGPPGSDARSAAPGHSVHVRPAARRRPRRVGARPLSVGLAVAAVLALVATSLAVSQGWIQPLAGRSVATTSGATGLFGPDIDPTSVRTRLVGTGAAPLTLWSASSPALGQCLAVTSASGGWSAAPAPDAGWRPLGNGAACLDNRVTTVAEGGAGLIARFVDDAERARQEVFAGPVTVAQRPYTSEPTPGRTATTTPDNGPTSDVVRAVDLTTSDGRVRPAAVGDGLYLTSPVAVGGCPTVVARNGAGTVLSSDVVADGCPGSAAPVAVVASGSGAADIHLNNAVYADGLSVGLSALTRRDPTRDIGNTDGLTALTLSVQFFDACQSPVDPAGSIPFPDPCTATRIPIPTDVDLQLSYGSTGTPAVRDEGRSGPDDDFTSPATPGYVGGKVFGLLVYRTFLVPDDQLGLLTARWAGDSVHAPLVMDGVQRALT